MDKARIRDEALAVPEFTCGGEERRWLAGRDDWRADEWQDHCGDPGCIVCPGYIPEGNQRLAAQRAEALKSQEASHDNT